MPHMSGTLGDIGVSAWCLYFMIDDLLLNASIGGYVKILENL